MKQMSSAQVRQMWLDFWATKGHATTGQPAECEARMSFRESPTNNTWRGSTPNLPQ